jgi:hypothetical protein
MTQPYDKAEVLEVVTLMERHAPYATETLIKAAAMLLAYAEVVEVTEVQSIRRRIGVIHLSPAKGRYQHG